MFHKQDFCFIIIHPPVTFEIIRDLAVYEI
jgi:hypothetical protein